ncbi:MAG: DMT family transporter [Candidatus Methanomethylophilaceae archaeon]|nr:DMT family transporter [Candidatus Methanomethylophilaceae archaeon]
MYGSGERAGALAALAAGIIWGFLGPFVRGCASIGITPMQMTCLRYIIVALIMAPIMWHGFRGKPTPSRRSAILIAIMAIIGISANSTLYFESMTLISLSMSTVLQYLAPFIVVAVSVPLFGESLTKTKAAAVIVAFLGCVLCANLISDPGSMDPIGILCGAVSGFCFATYTICSKDLSENGVSATEILFYGSLVAIAGLAPFCDLPSAFSTVSADLGNLALIVALGIFMTLLPFALFNWSLKRIEAGKTSVITFAEPMTATALGLILYGEDITLETAAGLAMILIALMLVGREKSKDSLVRRSQNGYILPGWRRLRSCPWLWSNPLAWLRSA